MTRCILPTYSLLAVLALSLVLQADEVSVNDAVAKAEKERIEAIQRASSAAVSVFGADGNGGGSGVVISPDGYCLTNFHVYKPIGDYLRCSMSHGVLYDAVVVGIDPTGDVALIKLLGRDDFPTAVLGDSDEVRVGDWCFAVGNPFLLATDFKPTVTYGIVSGVHRYQYPAGTLLEYADCIQTDASINPGNSGGPLFNAQGELIGINGRGSFEKRGRVNVGVGYAISINQIKHFMGYLRSGRIVDHATLGATVASDEEGRVVVSNILESSDAFRRGLDYGDEIISFGGRPIETVNQFKNVLGIFPRGWRIPLTFLHDGERREVVVRLAGLHGRDELIAKTVGRRPPQSRPGGQPPQKPQDPPKDEEKKEGDQPPEKPQPKPQIRVPKKAKVPAAAAKLIQPREGYANYYFNALNRDRVWKKFTANGDFSNISDRNWIWKGATTEGSEVNIVIDPNRVVGRFGNVPAAVEDTADLDTQLEPLGSGGLLAALRVYRHLLTVGPKEFGDLYYLGTMPVQGREGNCDVLVGTYDVVEARFMFDPTSGNLVAMEMYPEANVDPCEIRYDDFRAVDGRQVPHQLTVLHGNDVYGVIELRTVDFSATEEKKDATP